MNTYLAAFRSGLSSLLEYRMDYFSNSFLSLLVLIGVQYFLWDSVFAGRENQDIGQYTSDSMFLYVVFAALFGVIIRSGRIEKNVSEEIRKGDLNKYLIKPISHLGFSGALATADRVGVIVSTAIIIPFIPLFTHSDISWVGIAWSSILVTMAMIIKFFISMGISYLAFWFEETWTFHVIFDISMWFLSGSLVPLDLLPDWLAHISSFLPFQYLSYVPAALSAGLMPLNQAGFHILICFCWCIFTWLITRLIWNAGIRSFGAYGG
jgi:ABC-2 type transport system permease protein